MISVEEAVDKVLARAAPLPGEQCQLLDALGAVLTAPVVAERRLPPWDNSAMDGYAVRAAEVVPGRPLPIRGTVGAGATPGSLAPGSAVRIMTGAPIPDGADAVIMREASDERVVDGTATVAFTIAPRPGDHLRRAGEDVTPGSVVLDAGSPIGAGEVGLLAALGRTLVEVHRRPRVGIVSTGSELVEPDRPPGPGQIAGSNALALAAACRLAGAVPTILPIVDDDPGRIRARFAAALDADVVVSTGGVSVGDFDYVRAVLDDLGVVQEFWKVAMKPGKPVAFGTLGRRLVFGLPGNPASSMVGFELFVRPALLRLAGHREVLRPRAQVTLAAPYRHDGKRRHFVRAVVRRDGARLEARILGRQGSGLLRSLVGVNALLDVPGESGPLAPGSALEALLLAPV